MEVASPLTFPSAGTKRSLACSPGLMEGTGTCSPFPSGMDLTDDNHMQRAFKRRRYQGDMMMDTQQQQEGSNTAGFPQLMNVPSWAKNKNMFSSGNASMKRCRQDALSPAQNPPESLERVVETQATEIEYLKNAKANLESSLESLKSDHEKILNENRILKRAVTIQQERQTQASNHLEAARQFKVDAEQNIRRLEQMILSLRYHLQAQHPVNDFMGFPPQPPDVY